MTYQDFYHVWCKSAPLSEAGVRVLKEMASNDDEMKGAFGAELQFGTAGIRGIMGLGTNRLNDFTVRRTAQGLAYCAASRERRFCPMTAFPCGMGQSPSTASSPWRRKAGTALSSKRWASGSASPWICPSANFRRRPGVCSSKARGMRNTPSPAFSAVYLTIRPSPSPG